MTTEGLERAIERAGEALGDRIAEAIFAEGERIRLALTMSSALVALASAGRMPGMTNPNFTADAADDAGDLAMPIFEASCER